MKQLLIAFLLFTFPLCCTEIPEKEIVVVIPSYNNKDWHVFNIFSVVNQTYNNFRIIYINDCSRDETGEVVERYFNKISSKSFRRMTFDEGFSESIPEITDKFKREINQEKAFFTLIDNAKRCGALENLYRAIHSCNDRDIIITVDGDDWLAHDRVLQGINQAYSSGEVWMTHGKLLQYPIEKINWCEPVPAELVTRNQVRQFKCPSHLRTFYAWIFKKIALKDLLFNGTFFPMTWDMAIMYPILEMAGERHLFIDEVNYVYNMDNVLNDSKVNAELQRELDRYIRSMPPYLRLETAPENRLELNSQTLCNNLRR